MMNNWESIINLMDYDTREQVAFELAPCTKEEFLKRYLELDPYFQNMLDSEFTNFKEEKK